MSCSLGYVAPQDLKVGGNRCSPCTACLLLGLLRPLKWLLGEVGRKKEEEVERSLAAGQPQLPLGPGEQQAPEREERDCRSGSRLPGRERSPWHLKRQALAPGA